MTHWLLAVSILGFSATVAADLHLAVAAARMGARTALVERYGAVGALALQEVTRQQRNCGCCCSLSQVAGESGAWR